MSVRLMYLNFNLIVTIFKYYILCLTKSVNIFAVKCYERNVICIFIKLINTCIFFKLIGKFHSP